jgi:4-amino-4-deoxy-L-arabinose transferase-like glycosyltransferase
MTTGGHQHGGAAPSTIEAIDLPAAILLALTLAAWHLTIAATANLYPDETYYWVWSRYPALAYYDHAPMVAWWIAASTWLFGDTALAIRLPTVLSTLGTGAAVYATARVLFDRRVAARAFLWLNVTVLVALGGLFANPDAPSAFFWALAFLAFAFVIRSGRGTWFLAVGFFAGLGILSKYTDLFLGLGIVLCLLVDRDLRRWWKSPFLWGGGLIAVAMFAPVVWWNYSHDWASFRFQFGRIEADGLDFRQVPGLFVDLFGLLNPAVAVFVAIALVVWLARRSNPFRREIGLIAASVAPLLAYMLFHSTHDRVEGNWLAPVIPGLVLIAAAAAETVPGNGLRRAILRVLRYAAPPIGAAVALAGLWILARPPEFAATSLKLFRGWPELARDADALRRQVGAKWIATDDYNVASELAFELLDEGVPVEQVTERIRYVFAPLPDLNRLGDPVLFILRREDIPVQTGCFADVKYAGSLLRAAGARPVQRLAAYRVAGPRADLFMAGCGASPLDQRKRAP